ncbi:MAG: MATE family efflux transporter, partial [Clostridia bacterium]|nr:MATE family efflux transporter [Clostridia bacterium]
VSPFYAVIGIKLMADGVLRGSGAMRQFMVATFSDLLLRVVLSFVLSPHFGTDGVWSSWPVGWTAAAVISIVFYVSGKWERNFFKKSDEKAAS